MSLRSFTLQDLVARNALLHGSRTAFQFEGQRVTHAEYAERGERLAAGLAAIDVGPGDRIAILAGNCPEYLELFAAAAHLAAILAPINVRLSTAEVAHVIDDASPKVVIASAEFRSLIPRQAIAGARCYLVGPAEGDWRSMSDLYAEGAIPRTDVSNDTPLLIIHTAAVGGLSRGAIISHGGLMAGSIQARHAWDLTPSDVNLGVLPLFHIGGIGLMLAAQQAGGATLLLPRFDPQSLVRNIDDHRGSVVGVFPPMLGALTDAAVREGSALASLRVVVGLDTHETISRFQATCPTANFWCSYGQTETSGPVCLSPIAERPGSAGRPAGFNTVAIIDGFDSPAPVGVNGEIIVRGPMVFHGYWRRDEDKALTFRHGWHHTGDIGHFDADGYLWYVGRSPAKQLIKSGGENVYPAEVENVILAHPSISAVAVIGVPDTRWGEAVKAICELKTGQALSAEELVAFVGARIAHYKRPQRVVFAEALPRTAAGLLDREAITARHGSS